MLTHEQVLQAIPQTVQTVDISGCGPKQSGKVRDIYTLNGKRILVTTDRVSAFDRVLGTIPFKGQVLNQLSAWWFEQTEDIVSHHVSAIPDPNVMIVHAANVLPVEVIVRGYITGVTKTSLWHLYEQGERHPYGIALADGLRKNDPLPSPVITPTTKAGSGEHDERLTREDILERGLVSETLWMQIEMVALTLFARGQAVARRAGLILVDTKYEFGVIDGRLVLVDEIHTPDSSRFWTLESYVPGREPEHFDKEYLRQWFAEQGYRGEGEPPVIPEELVVQMASRYITAYEKMTGSQFVPGTMPVAERVVRNVSNWVPSQKT
jgi:phosphoribosylaminoimidazole-succinocarboxamide synthase